MSGLVLALGKDHETYSLNIEKEYVKIKNKQKKILKKSGSYSLSFFSNDLGRTDNHFEDDDLFACFVGVPIYGGSNSGNAFIKIIKDYKKYDISKVLSNIDGHFFIVLQSKSERKIYFITDNSGSFCVYIYKNGGSTCVSTSALSLSRSCSVTINEDGLCQFLRTGMVCDESTIYNEIKLLSPGSLYTCNLSSNEIRESCYWRSPEAVSGGVEYVAAVDRFYNELISNFNSLQDRKIICDLTAGFDSRMILAGLMASCNSKGINTFVFGPEGSREVQLVREYWSALGVNGFHLSLPENWSDLIPDYFEKSFLLSDGEESAFYYAPICYANEVKATNFDLSVNGLGGELYRDFWWLQDFPYGRKAPNLVKLIKYRVLQYEYEYGVFNDKYVDKMRSVEKSLLRSYLNSSASIDCNTLAIDNIYFRQKIRRWASRTITTSGNLIDVFSPLITRACIEAAMALPPSYKILGRFDRSVISKNSDLSNLKMLNNAKCVEIKFKNIIKLLPLIDDYTKRLYRKLGQQFFSKTYSYQKEVKYSDSMWIAGLLKAKVGPVDNYIDQMSTGYLYDKNKLKDLFESAMRGDTVYGPQIGYILTLESRFLGDKIV